jgi:protein SCO1/2
MKMRLTLLLLVAIATPLVAGSPAASYFKDIVLTDQNGHRVRLYEDVMKDRTVVINSFFTSCQGSCPVMAQTFIGLQERYAARLGKDLALVSITVDPAVDTPPKLLDFARKANAKPGWYLLTGTPEEVSFALRKIGQATDSRETHMNIMVVGNDRTGLWKKAFALAKKSEIAAVVDSVLNDVAPPAPAASR